VEGPVGSAARMAREAGERLAADVALR